MARTTKRSPESSVSPGSDINSALEQLRASRERLAESQRIAHLGTWDWNIAAGILSWSDEIYRIFGVEPQSFGATYEAFLSYVHPDDRELVERAVDEALLSGTDYHARHRIVLPSGEEKIVHERGEVTMSEAGKPLRMLGTVQDVTEQVRLQEELESSRAYNRGLIEASADGLLTIDRSGIITDVNEQLCRMTGHPREELIGSEFASHCLSPKRARDGVALTFEKGAVSEYLLTLAHGQAKGRVFSFNATLYRERGGDIAGIFASARDVTEQKRAEETLQDERERFNNLLEMLPAYLVLLTPDYRVPFANRFFRERFGESQGRRCYEYLFERDEPCEECETFKVLETNAPHHWEWIGPDERNYDIFDFPFTDADGSPLIMEMGIDITEQKRVEKELRLQADQHAAILATTSDGYWLFDAEGRILDVNDAYCELSGYTCEELLGLSISDIDAQAAPEEIEARLRNVMRTGFDRYETRHRSKDGGLIDVEISVSFWAEPGKFVLFARDIGERKRFEEERQVTRFFDLALDMACIADTSGYFLRVNPAFESTLGWSPDEMCSEPFVSFVHPDDREATIAALQGLASGVSLFDFENRYRRKEGDYRSMLWRASPPTEQGLIYVTARDITEAKEQEAEMKALAEERELALSRTQALQRLSAGLVSATTPAQVVRIVFEQAMRALEADGGSLGVLSADRSEIEVEFVGLPEDVAETFAQISSDDDLPAAACVREGEAAWYSSLEELRAHHPQSAEMLEATGYQAVAFLPLKTEGDTIGFLSARFREPRRLSTDERAFAETIAEQCSQAVARARSHEERARRAEAALVLERVGDGIFRLDGAGRITTWNPAAARMTGVPNEEATGKFAGEILEGWDEPSKELELAPPEGTASRRSLPFQFGDTELWLSISGVKLPVGAVYAFHDVTAVHELERRQHDFIATVSHELRTPLASVYGALRTLQRSDLDSDQREMMIQVATDQCERLRRLVDEILVANEVDSTELRLHDVSIEPLEIVKSVMAAIEPRLSTQIMLELEAEDGLPLLRTDPDRLQQVLGNLLDNAIKYSPDGGSIRIEVKSSEGIVSFAVSDRGPGIPLVERERIFERFYRLDPGQTKGVGGTGLGLFICRELVEQMGGTISVASADGGGSVFKVDLPLDRHHVL